MFVSKMSSPRANAKCWLHIGVCSACGIRLAKLQIFGRYTKFLTSELEEHSKGHKRKFMQQGLGEEKERKR